VRTRYLPIPPRLLTPTGSRNSRQAAPARSPGPLCGILVSDAPASSLSTCHSSEILFFARAFPARLRPLPGPLSGCVLAESILSALPFPN
jgi:hypothetical protein